MIKPGGVRVPGGPPGLQNRGRRCRDLPRSSAQGNTSSSGGCEPLADVSLNRDHRGLSAPLGPPTGPHERDDNWPFFPAYNPLEDEPLPAERPSLKRRLAVGVKTIAIKAAWRTALFAISAAALYYVLVANGLLPEVVR